MTKHHKLNMGFDVFIGMLSARQTKTSYIISIRFTWHPLIPEHSYMVSRM